MSASTSWIKMRVMLVDHPIVEQLSDLTGEDVPCTIGRLFCIWAWLDRHSVDGVEVNTTRKRLDARAGFDGFCDALIRVGWIDGQDGCLTFVDFGKHNGNTAKGRAQGAMRSAKHRQSKPKTSEVTQPSRSHRDESVTGASPREDKSREDNSEERARFDAWWSSYPARRGRTKGNKGESWTQWQRLTDQERSMVEEATVNLAAAVSKGDTLPKDAQRFLRPPNKRAGADPAYLEWVEIPRPKRANDTISHSNDTMSRVLDRSSA